MALARPRRRHSRRGRSPRHRSAGSRRPRPSLRISASSPCAGCAAQGPGPAAPSAAPAPGRAPGAAGPGRARDPARRAGRFQMRARCGLRRDGEPDRPRIWAPRRGTGLGPRWRPRRLARGIEDRWSRRRGCQRRCGGTAVLAPRGLSAGTAPLRRGRPTADTGPAPKLAPPTPPSSAALPKLEAGSPRPAAPGPAHGPVAPPIPGLHRFLGSVDSLSAALAPPSSGLDHSLPCAASCRPAGLGFFARGHRPQSCTRHAVRWNRRRASPAS